MKSETNAFSKSRVESPLSRGLIAAQIIDGDRVTVTLQAGVMDLPTNHAQASR